MALLRLLFALLTLTLFADEVAGFDCPDDWIDCGNGNCIADLWRCDGDNDCGNFKDEHDCDSVPTKGCLSSQFACEEDGHCIPDTWRCDGEHDCDDGSDEHSCANDTHCHGFKCKNNHCIPESWKCDGRDDCLDGSDEDICSKDLCAANEFTCLSGTCLDSKRVCDSKKDCPDASDEGRLCSQLCNTTKPACNQNCRQTPKGPECYCNEGFKLGTDGKVCEDINECSTEGFCSQQCTNKFGSYECSCTEGYRLVNNSCQALGPEPILVFSTIHEIRAMYLRSKRYFPVHGAIAKAASVDVDPMESRVYWAEISNKSVVHSSKLDGSGFRTVLTNGILVPEGIAVDYVARNLYFTDSGLKQILACKMDGSMCHALHTTNIDKPRAIAVDPPEGLLYWSDWGEKTSGIYRSGMDGSRRTAMVMRDIKWPNGIAIDHASNRLYWSDAKLLTIEYITLDGKTRKVLLKDDVYHPYSLAVFEDNLYWSDWTTFTLETSNKFTGHKTLVMVRENGKHIMGVHVYHPVLARRANNPCWGSSCSHMCLIAPLNEFRCVCPPGFTLSGNSRTCIVDSNYPMILVNDESRIYHIRPETAGNIAISELPIGHIDLIGRLAYDWKSKTMFISDMTSPAIYAVNMTTMSRRTLVRNHLVSPEGLAFDPRSGNLYWADSNKGTVEVVSTTGPKHSVIVSNLSKPMDIALVPETGKMFVSTIGVSPSVWMFDMNGKNGKVLGVNVGLPMALAVHPSAGILYWADPRMGKISSLDYTSSNSQPKIVKEHVGNVMSLAVTDKFLYWTDSKHHVLHLLNHNGSHSNIISLPGTKSGLVSRKVLYAQAPKSRRSFGSDCSNNNGGCSFICLTSPAGRTCACPLGMQLSQDGKTCADRGCSSTEYKCPQSEKCIPQEYVCDGIKDCPDGSDELKCEDDDKKCPLEDFRCSNGRCILPSWKCDGRDDCGDNSDEKGCPPRQNCTSKQMACQNGECIPLLWRCDGEDDCKDGSDEVDCHTTTCETDTQIRCDHGQCIPISWACDGAPDCVDSTDERNCTTRSCGNGKFQCKDGLCIDHEMVCDLRKDCEDGEDEINCSQVNITCKAGKYSCKDGITCIYQHEVCDGYKDCTLGEDEANCTDSGIECTSEEYLCTNTSRCISRRWICDGTDDCGDGSDEPADCPDIPEPSIPSVCDEYACPVTGECISWSKVCDGEHDCNDLMDEGMLCSQSCTRNNGGCAQQCQRTPVGPKCSCSKGYVLSKDLLSCQDADECSIVGRCSHFCNNTKGGYKCTCAEGYRLEPDHRRCKSAGGTAYLLFMLPDEIRIMNFNWPHTIESRKLSNTATMRGMDWDSKDGSFYWADWEKSTINWVKNGTFGILVHTMLRPHYLRKDWITKNIYYTDDKGSISCCDASGKYCATIVRNAAPHITSLDIAPIESLMFWTVWESSPEGSGTLERAELDGSNRRVIVSKNIMWPSAVAVDHILKVIYWTDSKLHLIESADFNGAKRRTVISKGLMHPFSMTVFEDNLFWSDWSTSNLMRCDKFKGENCTKVYHGSVKAEVLMVQNNATQPAGRNRCANSGCPHICLPTTSGFVCKCDDHFVPVQSRCDLNPEAISTEATNRSCPADYCMAGAECVVSRGRYFCKCPPAYSGDHCEVTKSAYGSPNDSSWIVGVVLALIFVCLIVAIAFFCRKNREKLTKMGETVAVSFRNKGMARRGSRLIEDEEEGSCDELDIEKKSSKQSNFNNPMFGKKTRKQEESEDGFKRWESHDSGNSAFMNEEQSEESGFRILDGPRRTTDRILQIFKR